MGNRFTFPAQTIFNTRSDPDKLREAVVTLKHLGESLETIWRAAVEVDCELELSPMSGYEVDVLRLLVQESITDED